MITLEEIKKYYCEVFYIEDPSSIDLVLSIPLGANLKSDPLWLMILGASSSGKSELINILGKVKMCHQVSTLTDNTFLSGMRLGNGKDASLLHKIGKTGVILMKDFTTILAMKFDKRETIMSQMREIFDGHITKQTGNGVDLHWKGKINFVGGVTDSLFSKEGESAGMGRRSINYILPEQDRMKTLRASRLNVNTIAEKRAKLQDMVAEYVEHHAKAITDNLPEIEDAFSEELLNLSNFITQARTPTERDFQSNLKQIMWLEMPMRVSQQLHQIAQIFTYMSAGKLSDDQKRCMFKTALDCIPKNRRMALQILATYNSVTTKGLAQEANYPTKTAREWVEDLNALKICDRTVDKIGSTDKWILKENFREILLKYDPIIKRKEEDLIGDETIDGDNYDIHNYDPGAQMEVEKNAQLDFDKF